MSENKILVVDDDASALSVLKTFLVNSGFEVTAAGNGVEAAKNLNEMVFDLIVTDLRMPDIDGIALMKMAKQLQPQSSIIVMSASEKLSDAVAAMRFGAFDYIAKPFKFEEMLFTIKRALSYSELLSENRVLKYFKPRGESGYGFIIGESAPMMEIFRLIEKVACTLSTVLILGESGTGKELIAKAIHNCSNRAAGPFIKINCTAMPEELLESELFGHIKGSFTGAAENKKGLFEVAEGGTIFLDEIGSIPVRMQAKLLRALQEKEIRAVGDTKNRQIDVRVLAATNEDLQEKIERNEFREDLFFRLSVIPITLPPLRERKDDIPLLIDFFIRNQEHETGKPIRVTDDAMKALMSYSWPGNIRQLENLVKRLSILSESGEIRSRDLPLEILGLQKTEKIVDLDEYIEQGEEEFISLKEYLRNVENSYINNVVKHCDGDKEKAASLLGISLATLYRKI